MAAGARVALRANAILLATVVFFLGSAPDGLATLRHLLVGMVGAPFTPGVRLLFTGVSVGLARAAVPRVMLGSYGWQRSLPIDPRAMRRAAVAAVAMVQFPVTFFVLASAAVVPAVYRVPVDLWRVLSVPVMAAGIAALVVPDRRVMTRLLAAAGVAASVFGTWELTIIAAGWILGSDVVSRGWGERRSHHAHTAPAATSRALSIWVGASWRAIGARAAVEIAIAPLVVCAFAYFIVANNALPPAAAARPVRVCGAIALALMAAGLSNTLLQRRPPWAWARSLPWTAMRRVLFDAVVIGVPLLIVPLALAITHAGAAAWIAAAVPASAAIGAASMRAGASRQTGAAGESLLIIGTIGALIASWPLVGVAALALTPLALRWAASRERRAAGTRWEELHHAAAGDPGWFTA